MGGREGAAGQSQQLLLRRHNCFDKQPLKEQEAGLCEADLSAPVLCSNTLSTLNLSILSVLTEYADVNVFQIEYSAVH